MKHVFIASYKSFYYTFIAILWSAVVIFALLQSGFVLDLLFRYVLHPTGLNVKSVNGGLLSGIELKGVKFNKLFSATEIRLRPNIIDMLDGDISLSYLDIKDLQIDENELKKLLKEPSKRPELIKSFKIDNISLTAQNISYNDLKLVKLKLLSDYLFFDFDKFYLDVQADISTNVLDMKIKGDVLDKNYSFRGTLASNGSQYINKIVDDVDFDFNALKETDFLVRGDDASLYAKAHIKNSGYIYKYGVNARINDVLSEIDINFKNPYLKVASKGIVESTYGDVDAAFDVVYDGNKTTYCGKGKAIRFKHIPLGVFTNGLHIKEAKNSEISFFGDVHRVEVKAKNKITATLLGERFDVDDSDTLVAYDIDKEFLKVTTNAKLHTNYFTADVENIVEDGGKTLVHGNVSNFANINLGIEQKAFATVKANYEATDDALKVAIDGEPINLRLNSKGYDKFEFTGNLAHLKPIENGVFGFLKDTDVSAKINGHYQHSNTEVSANITPINSVVFGKKLESSTISFKKTPHVLDIEHAKLKLAGVSAEVSAKTKDGKLSAIASTDSSNITVSGTIHKELDVKLTSNLQKLASEYAKITDTKKQNIGGNLSAHAVIKGELDSPTVELNANSADLEIGGELFSNTKLNAKLSKQMLEIKELSTIFQNKSYHLTKPANIHIQPDGFYSNEISINDTLTANASYQNDILRANAKIKNFSYKDGKKLKFTLNADATAVYQNKLLSIEGDARLKDTEIGYELKSSRITKDKDIIIQKPKRVEFDEKRFLNTVAMRINISNEGRALYKSKEAYAPMDFNLIYYKDYGTKPMMIGLVQTSNGYYDFEGKRFALLPSKITMTQTEPNNPYLDLTLKHVDKDAEILVYVREFASSPKISFSSNPAMSEKEIISYLLFGVDPDSSFTKTSNDARYSSKAIGALSNALSRDLTSEFGIKLDKVEIAPTEITDKTGRTTQTTKVEVGKRVTKDLTVTYKNDIESSVVFEYQINKNVNVESQAGRKSSIDIFYKKDY